MTTTKTRRQKVAAMAEQTASPEEAAVAQALLATMEQPPLERIATDIKSIAARTIEGEFAIGRLLTEAASILDPKARKRDESGKQSGSAFTDWFEAQGFPFSMKTARRLRIGIEREPEVRALIEAKVGRDMGVNTAVQLLLSPPKATGEVVPVEDATPADPSYDAIRKAHRLLLEEGGFTSLHIDDLAKVAGFIKDLAAGYTAEKARRVGDA